MGQISVLAKEAKEAERAEKRESEKFGKEEQQLIETLT